MRKNKKQPVIFMIAFLLLVPILLGCKCLIRQFPGGLAAGLLLLALYLGYGTLLALYIVWIIRHRKENGWLELCSSAIILMAVYLCLIFPFTGAYARLHYSLYQKDLLSAVEAVDRNDLGDVYGQIDETEYLLPNRWLSFSGTMYVEKHGDSSHVYFLTHSGLFASAYLVYVSNGSSPEKMTLSYSEQRGVAEEYGEYWRTKELSENWYFVLDLR